MKRRDLLWSLVGLASTETEAATTPVAPSSAEAIEALMRARGLEPRAGEAAAILAFLASSSARPRSNPRIEPAIRLEPDIDPKDEA